MTRRRIDTLQPFAFQADFQVPAPPVEADAPSQGALPLAELAAIGAQLQAEAAEAARAPLDAALVDRLESAIARLGEASALMGDLAAALDHARGAAGLPHGASEAARRSAQALCDGQGDLFAVCQALQAKA